MAQAPKLATGDLVDKFKVLKPLGAGGFAEVYLAIGMHDGRDVALKVLHKDSPRYAADLPLFKREIQLYQAVAHPNVVNYVASGETPGLSYVALEHIRGQSVRTKLNREGPSGPNVNFGWLYDLVLALCAAHQRGIVHRDIKPENIMLTYELGVKLIDFGIASTKEGAWPTGTSSPVPSPGAGTGPGAPTPAGSDVVTSGEADMRCTPAYASPEQLLGRPVDFRTDIFSLGLVFFEMMTGRMFIQSPTDAKAILRQHMLLEAGKRRLLPLPETDALGQGLEELLRTMLRFDPERRCKSTNDLVRHLQAVAQRAGGAAGLLAPDDASRLAQRELVDTHYWNATNLLHDRKVFEAVDELVHVTAFAGAVDRSSLPALLGELDVIVINLKPGGRLASDPLSVSPEDFLTLSGRFLDVYGALTPPAELPVRERLVVERVRSELEPAVVERFFQEQTVRRPHSYTFAAGYVRHILTQNPEIAKRIWTRVVHDLLRRELLLEAEREKRSIEELFGGRIFEPKTLELYGQTLERREGERALFQQALGCLERSETPEKLVGLCRNFLDRYPRDVPALLRLRRYQMKLERFAEATETLHATGLARFVAGDFRGAQDAFVRVLDESPRHEGAVMALYTVFLVQGKRPRQPLGDYRSLQEFAYATFGVVTPALRKLEAGLTGGPGDARVFERCAALLKERGRPTLAADYLLRLGGCLMAASEVERARGVFAEATALAKDAPSVYRRLMAVPGIRRLYNPMELSRRAAGEDEEDPAES